jgi:hypothetical protein
VNRLDVQLKKLGSVKDSNGQLREQVDALRRERVHFNGVFDRLKG